MAFSDDDEKPELAFDDRKLPEDDGDSILGDPDDVDDDDEEDSLEDTDDERVELSDNDDFEDDT